MRKSLKGLTGVLVGLVLAVALTIGISRESRAEGWEYRNIMTYERFVDNLKDPAEVEYRNSVTLESFINAMKDPCQKDDGFTASPLILAQCEDVERTPIY